LGANDRSLLKIRNIIGHWPFVLSHWSFVLGWSE
jgi:uncharacterized membrane protein